MMKKILAVILTVAVVCMAFTFFSCGKGADNSGSGGSSSVGYPNELPPVPVW